MKKGLQLKMGQKELESLAKSTVETAKKLGYPLKTKKMVRP
ncbi:hypothetical protein [Paenibacillus terrae]|nr:hypothetical protein [Paenibacillus terrae]